MFTASSNTQVRLAVEIIFKLATAIGPVIIDECNIFTPCSFECKPCFSANRIKYTLLSEIANMRPSFFFTSTKTKVNIAKQLF